MSPHEFRHSAARYSILVTLAVEDAAALWAAAALRGLSMPGATLESVVDTIGPREDPSVADCIALLAAPPEIPGCALEDFDVSAGDGEDVAQPVSFPAVRAILPSSIAP